jgi:pimeloyl-ACP methyl ester carboxylesterase/DNA-binding winged helix-turn-helix (wHTH) protein
VFDNCTLDTDRRELHRDGQAVPVEPQVFDLLEFLMRNRERVVSRDDVLAAVWDGRIVSESAVTTRMNAARLAIGDSGEAQRLIRTFPRKGFRFVGGVREQRGQSLGAGERDQNITFCRTTDGFNLATAIVGTGLPLVRTTTWLNHLEYEWQDPIRSPMLRSFANRFRLVRYDGRGNGLSDRDMTELSIETFLEDLEAVINAAGLTRYAMMGISQGAATAIAHAARHPERVSKLVLFGAYALGRNKRSSKRELETAEAYVTLMRHGWGDENSSFIRMFSTLSVPNATPAQIKSFAELQRIATSAENAVRLRSACDDIDVVDLLPKISVPTLVLHSRHDHVVPYEEGRRVAAGIPNARFVTLESENHMPQPDDLAWPKFIREIENFLSE